MADNIENNLDYLKEKFPSVHALRFAARPNGVTMYLDLTTHTREEFFKDITMAALTTLARVRWPQAFQTPDGAEELQIFSNGKLIPLTGVVDLDDAYSLIRQLEIEFDELITVKDTNGQLVARYVSNRNGEIKRLEE